MKKNIFIISILLLFACNTETTTIKEQKNNPIEITQLDNEIFFEQIGSNKKNVISEIIAFKIRLKNDDIDSCVIKINDKRFNSYSAQPDSILWNTSTEKLGENKIKVTIYKDDKNLQKTFAVVLCSDIIPKKHGYKVLKSLPHDKYAYTQGLFIHKGLLYEATGLKGESTIRKTKLETGEVLQSYTIPNDIFGEGITLLDDKIFQLSWQDHIAYIYDAKTFAKIGSFQYDTEGWGLTNDGKQLIMSVGTNVLYFIDAQSYTVAATLEVYDNQNAINYLNELEYIDGVIYANIYLTNNIAKIEAKTGKVLAYINMEGILPTTEQDDNTDVLNGIAYDFDTKKLYVTGKRWSKLFEIEIK